MDRTEIVDAVKDACVELLQADAPTSPRPPASATTWRPTASTSSRS